MAWMGRGDGPVADTLKKKPANLTLLSKNNGGKFPYDHVYNMISGQEVVASHGTREMPIWGVLFASRDTCRALQAVRLSRSRRESRRHYRYIESIQAQ